MTDHETIERVYRSASIAFEIKWQQLKDCENAKIVIILALSNFIDRELITDLYNIPKNYPYLVYYYKALNNDLTLKTKYNFIINNCLN